MASRLLVVGVGVVVAVVAFLSNVEASNRVVLLLLDDAENALVVEQVGGVVKLDARRQPRRTTRNVNDAHRRLRTRVVIVVLGVASSKKTSSE